MRRIAAAVLSLLVVLVAGVWIGGHPSFIPSFMRGPFVDEDTQVVADAIDTVQSDYYRKIPRGKLADQAIEGLVAGLDDRFSNYFSPAQYQDFQQSQASQFSGIGVGVREDPLGLKVLQVYDASPADRAGLKVNDVIVAAGGRRLKGLDQNASTALVKGPTGSDVVLAYRRGATERTARVTRATVSVPQVASRLITRGDDKVGYVALAQFGSGAHAEVYAALRALEKRGAKRFVFDLRRNGGGLVSEAQLIASAFLADGPIVTTKGRNVPTRTLRATGEPVAEKQPLVVLVDGDTASASEIVAGALQDRDRAQLVGTRTFGKGVFQEVIELDNGGALDITAGQYFTPDGRNLGGQGVKTGTGLAPDVSAKDDPDTQRDEALQTALATVVKVR